MLKELKQFGEKDTESLKGQFHLARMKLTVVYALLLAAILCFSSVVLFSTFTSRLDVHIEEQRLRHTEVSPPFLRDFPTQARDDLSNSLIIVNGILLIGSAILSYWLAGLTLLPVQEAFEKQRRFLSDASHELRTPLTILQTDLENELEEKSLKGEQRARAVSQLEEVERMGGLVKDLLLLSRLDVQDGPSEKCALIDARFCAQVAVERFNNYAKKQHITLTYTADEAEVLVRVPKELLIQAVSNVVKNGIEYNTPNGSVEVNVVKQAHSHAIIIKDTGIGIAAHEVTHLFDRFFRVDKSRSRQLGGSGLGLSIVNSIVSLHGGTVDVQSVEAKGTTVTLSWPA